MTYKVLTSILLCLAFVVSSCSDDAMTREEEIRQYINQGVEAAEKRSSSNLADLIDDSYRDQKGLAKLQVKKMLSIYFFRHKNIHLFTKIREIKFHSDDEATVTLHVAMAGSVISDASMLSNLTATIYKFELQLIKKDEWLLHKAKWQRAGLHDMQ